MTNQLNYGLHVIGVRALVQDVVQYQRDGRTLTKTNELIAASQEKTAAASTRAARIELLANRQRENSLRSLARTQDITSRNILDAQRRLQAAQARAAAAALTDVTAPGTRIPKGQPGAGQFQAASGKNAQGVILTGEAFAKAKKESDAAEASVKRFQGSVDKIKADNAFRLESGLIGVKRATEDLGYASQRAANIRRKAELEELQLQQRLIAAQRERIRIAVQLASVAAVATTVAITGASLGAASKYEDILVKIRAQTNASAADVEALNKVFLEQSQVIPVSAIDQAEAAYITLSSGVKNLDTAQQIVTKSSQAQTAQMGKAADFARTLTAVINAYGETNIDVATAADIVTQAIKSGSVEASDYIGQIGRVVGIAPQLNVKFSELAATTADLTNRGLTASEAFTAVLGVLNQLQKQSPAQAEALAGVGLDFEKLLTSIRDNGFVNTLIDIEDRFRSQGKNIRELFPEIRALNGLLNLTSRNGKTLIQTQGEINQANGALSESFEESKGRISAVAQLFKNQLNVALIKIGTDLLPLAVKALQDLSEWLKRNQEEIRKFIVDGVKAAAAIINDFIQGIKTVVTVLTALNGVLKNITTIAPGAATAVAGIGIALAWALPGSPVMKGLLVALALLGQMEGKSDKSKLAIGAATAAGAIGGAALSIPLTGGLGAVPFALAGAGAANVAANQLIGQNDGKNQDKLAAAMKEAEEAAKALEEATRDRTIKEKDLNARIAENSLATEKLVKAQKEAFEAAQKLAQAFVSSSEAAGQIDTLSQKLGLFGDVSKELAENFNLTARQAGQVEGLDAVIRARERENREIFQTQKLIGALAQAYANSGKVAAQITLELARSALQASQSALSDVLSAPTREIADLGVPLAFQRQKTTDLTFKNTPAINALNDQMKVIDKRIKEANKQRERAQKEADRQNKANQKAADQAARQRDAMLDQMKLANLQAQIAAERQLAGIQRLIDANTKRQSDLQEAFLKANEDLQLQINTAIGAGDTDTALSLTRQQRDAAKAYQDQNKALEKNGQNLTTQLKQAQEAEEERQREVRLAEALAEAQIKQQEASEKQTESIEANTEALDANIEAMEEQKDKIAEQIEALQAPIDASKRQEEAIQNAIDLYKSQTDILQAQAIQADKTLLTQEEQWQLSKRLIEQIKIESGAVKTFSDLLGISTVQSVNDANREFKNLETALQVTQGNFLRFLDPAFDAEKARREIEALATAEFVENLNTAGQAAVDSAEQQAAEIIKITADWQTGQEQILVATQSGVTNAIDALKNRLLNTADRLDNGFSSLFRNLEKRLDSIGSIIGSFAGKTTKKFDTGGFTPKSGGPFPAILHANEAVLPLNDPKRTQELLARIGSANATANAQLQQIATKSVLTDSVGGVRGIGVGGGTGTLALAALKEIGISYGNAAGKYSGGEFSGNVATKGMVVMSPNAFATVLTAQAQPAAVFAPNISVTGATLDSMEAMAIRAVQDSFRQARVSSVRGGSLLGQNIGPNR